LDELSSGMKEKFSTATDESHRDLNNLQEKLQTHEAFERELKSNNDRLEALNTVSDETRGINRGYR
jgi:spectrin beta